jgi:hypothetical protein
MIDFEKKTPVTGVGRMSQVDGGLDMELKDPEAERVGVAGKYDRQSVSIGNRPCISCCMRKLGFCSWRGDAAGVSIACEPYM